MALSDRKIPIITGRNDTPTTSQSEANHPNGSFLISKYNALIDNELTALETNLNNLDIPSSSDDLTEGTTNKYFSGKTTDNLPEGTTNKYYSDNRTRLAITVTGNGSYDNATGVINISNATLGIDHITLTSTIGLTKTYTIYADSGETINLGTFTVTDGQNGTNGTNGQDGVDGIDGKGITNTSYNASTGIVTFTFSDSTTFDTGDLRGVDGVDGVDGVAGQGIDHVRATAGVNGQWQTMTIFGDAGETITLGTFTVYHGPLVEVLTQSAYNALGTYDDNTFYVING